MINRLDERHLSSVIDARILRALDHFVHLTRRDYTHEQALRVAARFVRYVYRYAVPAPRTLSLAQAREEAVALNESMQNRIKQEYSVAVLSRQARSLGRTVERCPRQDGAIELRIRGYR